MESNNIWVIGFDKETGQYKDFCCCPKQDAKFYKLLYKDKGYRVECMTRAQLGEYLDQHHV